MLFDNHGRILNYLRLGVTDRCNLRCQYCLPEKGIRFLPKNQVLSFEEILRLVTILAEIGITKVRITGGEPFVRQDLIHLMQQISEVKGINDLTITTNGVLTLPHISALKNMGVTSVNLSLDTLNRERFFEITRRDELLQVLQTLQALLNAGFSVKINAVVMAGKNTDDIIPLIELARNPNVSVRFIEEMPFNGTGLHLPVSPWNHHRIFVEIQQYFPSIQPLQSKPFATAQNYKIAGFGGEVGIIAAYSRNFCGTCNRLRITPEGTLKTCLYDEGVLDIRSLLRTGISDQELQAIFLQTFAQRPKNGFEAESLRKVAISESMTTIGG